MRPRRPRLTRIACLAAALVLAACAAETGAPDAPRGRDGSAARPDAGPGTPVERTARLIHLEGEVHVKRPGAADWQPAEPGQELRVQDKLRTARDAFATLEFEHGGLLRLGPESLISVTDLRQQSQGERRQSTFTLVEGAVEAELDPLEGEQSEFRIKTPSAETSVVRREVAFQ